MNRKILSLFLTLIMVLGSFSTVFAVPYDVVGTTFEDAVVRLQELEVLIGYPDGSFGPSNNITRSEYAAVVARIKGLEQAASNSMGSTIFGDVPLNFWASGYINVSVQAGLIKGMGIYNGVNTFAPQANITYEQAVTLVVRALGYGAEAESSGGYPNGYLMIAAREGLLQDVNGTLGALATRGLVAQLTFNALDIELMGNNGEYLFNELRMINEAAASGNWGTINAATFTAAGIPGVTASNIGNLKSTLESLAGGTNQNWPPSAIQGVFDTLVVGKKVISAKATSATKVEIEFNTKLDATDAITILPYKLSISGVTFVGIPELSADGKTLMFTAGAPIDVNNAALIVEPIQTEENPTVFTDRHTSSFTYKDTVKPELDTIVSKTNTTIATNVELQFSEPIQAIATVKIDGTVESPVGFISGDDSANFTGLSLSASGTHTIQIVGLTDEQNNTTSLINDTFTVVVDTVLPKVSLSASPDIDNVIIAKFDKPVTIVSATAALVNGVVKNETLANIASLTAIPIDPAAGFATDFEIEVVAPFGSSPRNLTVLIPVGISDSVGNTVAATTKTVTLVKDTTDPKIETVGAMKDPSDKVMALILSIDSTLDAKIAVAPGPLSNDLTVIDPNGVLLDSSTWLGGLSQKLISAGDKKITMTFATPATLSGEYTITFDAGLATDQADTPNNLKSKTVTIDFGAASSSGTFSLIPADVTSGGTNIFVVDFGAPVKGGNVSGSATALANYSLNGTSLPAGTTITLNVAKDNATLTLPAESIATTDTGALFTIDNVKKLSGETLDAFVTTVGVVDNIKPVMDSAVLKNDNTLVVGISEGISTALPNSTDFSIKINGKVLSATPAFTAGIGSDAGKFILDLEPLVLNDGTQTYINIDGVVGYNAANDIFVKTEVAQTAFTMLTSPIVSSLTIEVVGSITIDNATPANGLKLGTIITAK